MHYITLLLQPYPCRLAHLHLHSWHGTTAAFWFPDLTYQTKKGQNQVPLGNTSATSPCLRELPRCSGGAHTWNGEKRKSKLLCDWQPMPTPKLSDSREGCGPVAWSVPGVKRGLHLPSPPHTAAASAPSLGIGHPVMLCYGIKVSKVPHRLPVSLQSSSAHHWTT